MRNETTVQRPLPALEDDLAGALKSGQRFETSLGVHVSFTAIHSLAEEES